MRSALLFLLVAAGLGACAELNKPAQSTDEPRAYEPPPPVHPADAGPPPGPAPSSTVAPEPGDVRL